LNSFARKISPPLMQKTTFDFQPLGLLPPIIEDYLAGLSTLQPFYRHPFEIEAVERVITARQQHQLDREMLAEVLEDQNASLELSEAVKKNIGLLRSPTTFTITAAHQTNLFSGYLYFFNKLLTAIKLAAILKEKYPAFDFVPVYWMGSEDHDFAELNHIYLHNKKIEWTDDQGGAVGWMSTASLQPVIGELEETLGDSPRAKELIGIFKKAYLEHSTVAAATRFLVHHFLGKYGLVVLDMDDARLKRPFIPVLQKELFEQATASIVEATSEALETRYKIQAHPRALNLFYLGKNLRSRIVGNATSGFEVLDTELRFSGREMETLVQEHPEKFSPNVLLRPLMQELILPNLAFVGGPGELAYWLQLRHLFEGNSIPYPMLVFRDIPLLLSRKHREKLEKLGLEVTALFQQTGQLVNNYVKQHAEEPVNLQAEKAEAAELYAAILEKAVQIDPTLEGRVKAEEQKHQKSLEHLESKLLKAEKRKFDTAIKQIRNLKERLFPDNTLQERRDNFIPFYLQAGPALFDELYRHFNPFEKKLKVLSE